MSRESQGSGFAAPVGPAERPLLLANPGAGAGRGRARLASLEAALCRWPRPPEIVWSEDLEHLAALAAGARRAGRRWVIAAGGDGTAHTVVNGLLGEAAGPLPELGFLPTGTSADFGRSLGLPRDRRQVVDRLPRWAPHPIDVGVIELADGRVVRFLNCANLGLAVQVAERVAASRVLARLGRLSYPLAAALEAGRAAAVRVRLAIDGQAPWEGEVLHLSVANGAFFGGGLRPVPSASLTSGRLHLLRLSRVGRLVAVRELSRALRQRAPAHPSASQASALSIEIAGEATIEADGQIPGRLPARFRVEPGALLVRCPGPVSPGSFDGSTASGV